MATRNYTMRARAHEVEARRAKIVRAMIDLSMERLTVDITLDDVAARAGVSVRTVLRQFGDRDGLLDAAVEVGAREMRAERDAPVGDIDAAVRALVADYEVRGDWGIRLRAQEDDPRTAQVVASGRLFHREWVETVFAPFLPQARGERMRAIDLLFVATDVSVWKQLRRDRALSRQTTEARMRDLVGAVLASVAVTDADRAAAP